jgi:hypothetical protein
MLSALSFAACGSDDGKNIVRNTDGGAGGEAGEPATVPSAGAAGDPPVSNGGAPAGGAGGEAPVGEVGGEAGAGGQPPVCTGFVTPAEGGAGGEGAVVPLRFRCEDLKAAGTYYDLATHKIVIPVLPGMEGTVTGRATLVYDYNDVETNVTECAEGQIDAVGNELELSTAAFDDPDVNGNLNYIDFSHLTLEDECGNTAQLDNSWTTPQDDLCWYVEVRRSDALDAWAIECYEGGGGKFCDPTCPTD